MIRKEIDDAVFDLLLKHAFRDAYAREVEQMDAEAGEPLQPPDKYRRIERRYYRRMQRKPVRAVAVFQRMVACFAICMSLGFGALMLTPSVRAAAWDSMVEFYEKYIAVNLPEKNDALVVDGHTFGYIPPGFELVESLEKETMSQHRFSNGVEEFTVWFYHESMATKFDAENGDAIRIDIDGIEAYWMTYDNNYNILFIPKENQAISIRGSIDIVKIKNIANNLS